MTRDDERYARCCMFNKPCPEQINQEPEHLSFSIVCKQYLGRKRRLLFPSGFLYKYGEMHSRYPACNNSPIFLTLRTTYEIRGKQQAGIVGSYSGANISIFFEFRYIASFFTLAARGRSGNLPFALTRWTLPFRVTWNWYLCYLASQSSSSCYYPRIQTWITQPPNQ